MSNSLRLGPTALFLSAVLSCGSIDFRLRQLGRLGTFLVVLCLGSAAFAQTGHFSGVVNTSGSGFNSPRGVAVDASGDVFVPNSINNAGSVADAVANDIEGMNGNFGRVNVGASSANPIAVEFTFDAVVTLGSTAVFTQGAKGLDFTDAGGGTCTPQQAIGLAVG